MAVGIQSWTSATGTGNGNADANVNFAEGQAPSSVNDSARNMMARIKAWYDDLGGITTGGSSTAYTITTSRVFASLTLLDKAIVTIIPHTTSGAAPTLNVDSLGAKQLRSAPSVNVPTGALISGTPYMFIYINATTEFILIGDVASIAGLDIDGGTALTAPDTADELAIYDASATANRKITLANFFKSIDTITALTAPDTADELVIYDASGTAAFKITLANFFKAIDTLTAKASPVAADEVAIYDVAGTAAKKSTLAQVVAAFIAAQADQETGTSTTTLVTPGRQHFHNSAAKAWANFNFSGSASQSYGVSSITDTGTGRATINLSTAMSAATYPILASGLTSTGGLGNLRFMCQNGGVSPGTTAYEILSVELNTGASTDGNSGHTAIFGDI